MEGFKDSSEGNVTIEMNDHSSNMEGKRIFRFFTAFSKYNAKHKAKSQQPHNHGNHWRCVAASVVFSTTRVSKSEYDILEKKLENTKSQLETATRDLSVTTESLESTTEQLDALTQEYAGYEPCKKCY